MKTIKYLFLALLATLSFASCDQNDFDVPPIEKPVYDGPQANITIQALKEKYASIIAGRTGAEIGSGKDTIISGVITANDYSGNIYKKLVIQDATGAIDIAINQTNLYNTYAVGQRIYLRCNGLVIGGYGGQAQLGAQYNGGVGQMTLETFQTHVSLDGWPVAENLPVIPVLTYADLTAVGNDSLIGMLVRFDSVYFEKGGEAIFSSGTTNEDMERNIMFKSGSKLVMRTSSYANFAKDTLPKGTGDIIGILGQFNGTWQFTLRTKDDMLNFNGENPGEDPNKPEPGQGDGTETNPYNVTYAIANQNNTSAWVKGYIVGCVKNGVGVFEDPSQALFSNFDSSTNVFLADNANETNYLKCVCVKLNDPTAPAGMRDAVNLLNNPDNKGKVLNVEGTLRAMFTNLPGIRDITNYKLKDSGTPTPPGGVIFSETFASGLGNFTVENVLGSNTWSWNSNQYAVMSGYTDGKNLANEDWLISPAINLTGKTNVKMSFEQTIYAGKSNPDVSQSYMRKNQKVMISNNYASGTPASAQWTELTLDIYPGGNSWTFVTSTASVPAGFLTDNVRIAFKYTCDDTLSASWELKNMEIK